MKHLPLTILAMFLAVGCSQHGYRNIDMDHAQYTVKTENIYSCPEGYGLRILDKRTECVQLSKGKK